MGIFKDDPIQRGLNQDGSERLSYEVNQPDVPKEYQGLLDANPYTNIDYKQSNWQRLLSNLGFRTGYDKRKEDMQLQANEWNANVAAMAFENQYNDPAAQASRMREAGMNPDILGTGDVAQSAGMPDDMNPPAPTESEQQVVFQVGQALLSGFSTAFTFAKDLASIEGMNISNAEGLAGLGSDTFGTLLPDYILESGRPRTDLALDVLNRGSEFSRSLPSRQRKRYMANLQNWIGSMDFQVASIRKATEKPSANADFYKVKRSSGADDDLDETTLTIADTLREIAETQDLQEADVKYDTIAAEGAEAKARSAEAGVRQETAEAIDGALAGEAINAENRAKKSQKTIEAQIAEPLVKGMNKLEDQAKSGNKYSSKALLGISIAAMTTPVLGNILKIAFVKRMGKFRK